LIISGITNDFRDAIPIAMDSIKSGRAYDAFKNFIHFCGNIEKVEEFEKV
jgi:anthranilate phosphoribosyltransferase